MRRSYNGLAVVLNEQLYAARFRERLNYLVPSLSESHSFLRKIVFSDITVSIISSPLLESEIESNTSIISFGSPGYNKASSFIEKSKNSAVKFVNDNTVIQIENESAINNPLNGIIQRLVSNSTDNKRNLFYVAGLSERGTIGAANYLAKNWKSLSKRYKDDESFIVVVTFPTENIDNYSVVLERKIE